MLTILYKNTHTIAGLQISMNDTFWCLMVQIVKAFAMYNEEACILNDVLTTVLNSQVLTHLLQSPLPTSDLVEC